VRIGGVAATAAAAATVVWLLWAQVGGVDLEVKSGAGSQQIGIGSVIVSSLLIALAGGALLRWWEGRSERGPRRWTMLAAGIAGLSLITPTSALTVAAGLGLVSLHLESPLSSSLAWVVREGATNVLRHSGAASCRFELTEAGGEFRLEARVPAS
jgi:hypothetical protein